MARVTRHKTELTNKLVTKEVSEKVTKPVTNPVTKPVTTGTGITTVITDDEAVFGYFIRNLDGMMDMGNRNAILNCVEECILAAYRKGLRDGVVDEDE